MVDMRKLISLQTKDEIMCEVSKLSEEDAKVGLIMVLLAWRKGNEINEEITKELRYRIEELERSKQ